MTQTATATQAIAKLKAALAKIDNPTKATTKCCIWCGFGDHYTDEIFTKDGKSVAHWSNGNECDATGFTNDDIHEPQFNYRHIKGECELVGCVNN